jgi:hypothetical protein
MDILAQCLHYFPNSFVPPPTSYVPTNGGCVHADGGGGPRHEVRSLKLKRMEGAWAHPWGWRWKQWLSLYMKSCMFIFILKVMVNIIYIRVYTKILGMSWQYIASLHVIPSPCSLKCVATYNPNYRPMTSCK